MCASLASHPRLHKTHETKQHPTFSRIGFRFVSTLLLVFHVASVHTSGPRLRLNWNLHQLCNHKIINSLRWWEKYPTHKSISFETAKTNDSDDNAKRKSRVPQLRWRRRWWWGRGGGNTKEEDPIRHGTSAWSVFKDEKYFTTTWFFFGWRAHI